ncbi:MAG: alanine racemase [Oscillospiraceae bacterium]|nr:alanine racemase [Oscillospiraceae bacterium]
MIAGDTVIRVSLKKLGENLDRFRALVGEETAVMAVIKANGYGHGAVAIAPTLLAHGATYLAVARIEEALPLRQALPDAPLFVLGYTPDRLLPLAVENNITLTVFSPHQAGILGEAAIAQNKTATVHLKVETGFNRLGTDSEEELLKILETPGIRAEGIYSHLALKDRPSDEIQFSRFLSVVKALESKGHSFRYLHIADSISAVDYPDFRLNMVRPGALLYGMVGYEDKRFAVEPIMQMETRIARLRKLEKGEGVGYDLDWIAQRESVIATLPFGYADGCPRALGGRGYVLVRGHKCPLVGIMCMDQCVADVTDVPDVAEGDPVIIYGDGTNRAMTVAEVANIAGSNKNEILCRLTARPVRIYEESCLF